MDKKIGLIIQGSNKFVISCGDLLYTPNFELLRILACIEDHPTLEIFDFSSIRGATDTELMLYYTNQRTNYNFLHDFNFRGLSDQDLDTIQKQLYVEFPASVGNSKMLFSEVIDRLIDCKFCEDIVVYNDLPIDISMHLNDRFGKTIKVVDGDFKKLVGESPVGTTYFLCRPELVDIVANCKMPHVLSWQLTYAYSRSDSDRITRLCEQYKKDPSFKLEIADFTKMIKPWIETLIPIGEFEDEEISTETDN